MLSNLVVHYLVKTKFNLTESTVTLENDSFIVKSNDGQIFTEKDFTKAEIKEAEAELLKIEAQAAVEAAAKQSARLAVLEKLGLTTDEAKLLLG